MRLLSALVLAIPLAACPATDPGTPDAGDVPDSGAPVDGGSPPDAGAQAAACEARAGAYEVVGTCSNGGDSVPFACLAADGCEITWIADFRTWTGNLVNRHYELSGNSGAETIVGDFTGPESADYTWTGGDTVCASTASRLEPDDASRLCCDVLAQDCDEGEVCVPHYQASVDTITTGCREALEERPIEADCDWLANGELCEAGSACVRADGGLRCRRLCTSEADCSGSETCIVIASAPRAGYCAPQCDLFATENPCGDGFGCGLAVFSTDGFVRKLGAGCFAVGTRAAGEACSGQECAAGLVCSEGQCRAFCDESHACTTGACEAFDFDLAPADGVSATLGACK